MKFEQMVRKYHLLSGDKWKRNQQKILKKPSEIFVCESMLMILFGQ